MFQSYWFVSMACHALLRLFLRGLRFVLVVSHLVMEENILTLSRDTLHPVGEMKPTHIFGGLFSGFWFLIPDLSNRPYRLRVGCMVISSEHSH